jgi:putative transcriptional regulator
MPIVRKSTANPKKKKPLNVDWEKVDRTTDADIARQVAEDPDTAPLLDAAWFRKARLVLPETVDVSAIRDKLGLSQRVFAARFGFSLRTVQQWEQGRAVPERPARILLKIIESEPQVVDRVLTQV